MLFSTSVCVCVYYFGMPLTSTCRIFLHIKHNILLTIAIKLSSYLDKSSNSSNKTCISHLHYMSPIHDTLNIEYLYINISCPRKLVIHVIVVD